MLRKKQSNEKREALEWDEPQRVKLKKCIKLQSRTEVKPYFCNYSQFLFNPANYLKCDSRTLDFSELRSITLSYVSFSKVKWALIAFQITSDISETTVREKPGLTICLAWSYMELGCISSCSAPARPPPARGCVHIHVGHDQGQRRAAQVSWAGWAPNQLLHW